MARDSEAFVRISDDGLHFQVADRPFFFAGANCYYLLVGTTSKPRGARTVKLTVNKTRSLIAQPERRLEPRAFFAGTDTRGRFRAAARGAGGA